VAGLLSKVKKLIDLSSGQQKTEGKWESPNTSLSKIDVNWIKRG
jgi:hypothetical protein